MLQQLVISYDLFLLFFINWCQVALSPTFRHFSNLLAAFVNFCTLSILHTFSNSNISPLGPGDFLTFTRFNFSITGFAGSFLHGSYFCSIFKSLLHLFSSFSIQLIRSLFIKFQMHDSLLFT